MSSILQTDDRASNYGSGTATMPVNDAAAVDGEEAGSESEGADEEEGRRCCTCAHPVATFFHLFFKALAIAMYLFLYLVIKNFVVSFVFITLCLAFDFWTTKNVTGRLMVGLRWWNEVHEDGKSVWRFESLPDKDKGRLDPVESMIFWGAVVLEPAVWIVCVVLALLSIPPKVEWAVLVFIALVLSCVNFAGYVKCARGARRALRRAATKKATQVAAKAVIAQATA